MSFPNARFDSTKGDPADPGGAYVYHDPRIELAVNVALAARRPLFVTGAPGSGKSTLAADVASRLDVAYLAETITSRTRIEDLVARFDAVARLSDAQDRKAGPAQDYMEPGILWWAFHPQTAADQSRAVDRRIRPGQDGAGTVLLLDEIDKAEPDLPNDLLEPLDRFTIRPPGQPAVAAAPQRTILIVITSNGERSMPPAFLRRCVALELDDEDEAFFLAVARSHFGDRPDDDTLYADVATRTRELARTADTEGRRRPSMAEYLDTLRACIDYNQDPGRPATPTDLGRAPTPLWAAIEEAALRKTRPDAAVREP
jgi:MoxR-like ATPase